MRIQDLSGQFVVVALGISLLPAMCQPSAAQGATSVEDCRRLVREKPKDLESYRCFWRVARGSGNWKASEDALRQLLQESPGNPRAKLFLGSVLADQGLPDARSVFLEAADGFAEIGDFRGECLALISVIAEHNRRRQIEQAEPLIERARVAAEESGDEDLADQVNLARGWFFVAKEDFDQASEIFDRLQDRLSAGSAYTLKYRTAEARAFVAWATGRYQASSELYRRCLDLAREAGDVHDEAASAYNMLLVTARLRGSQVSVEHLQSLYADALDAALRSGNASLEANARMSIGQPFDGDPRRRDQIQKALAAARRAEDPMMEMAALRGLAQHDVRSDPSRWPDARAEASRAVELAQRIGNADALIRGYLILATTFEETQDRDQALDAWYRAIDEIEQLHRQQITEETAARVASRWSFAYYDLFARLVDPMVESASGEGAIGPAIALMERLRDHSRGELFTQAGAHDVKLPDTVTELPLSRVRTALAENEALLTYQLSTRGEGWVIVASPKHSRIVTLPDVPAIDEAIELVSTLITQEKAAVNQAFTRLSALIIDTVLSDLEDGVSRLVIVPDGNLFRVPFAALRPGGERYLVETHTIEVTPSVLDWLEWREQPEALPEAAMLGFANPSRPQDTPSTESGTGPALQDVTQPLPHSVAEVKRACKLVGNKSRWYAGSDATKAMLGSAIEPGRPILHFATHAVVDGDNPQNTAILLAPNDDSDDGRLTISDILALDHGARLVIVNSCRSTSGVILQGRGVLGLAAGFRSSGARAVVGNLWSVGDSSAGELMLGFYEELVRGSAVAEALAVAQRDSIREGLPPRVWASLNVHGDGRFAFREGRSRWPSIGLLVVIGFLVLLGVVAVRAVRNG